MSSVRVCSLSVIRTCVSWSKDLIYPVSIAVSGAELSDIPVPAALADLKNKPERFCDVIDKAEQKDYVLGTLGI